MCDKEGTTFIVSLILDQPSQRTCALLGRLLPKGLPMLEYDMTVAAKVGHLLLLQRRGERDGVLHVDKDAANNAAWHGFFEIIQLLRAYGYHCDSEGVDHAIYCIGVESDDDGYARIVYDLIDHGIYPSSIGADWSGALCNLEFVEHLIESGVQMSSDAAGHAAENGNLQVLKFLHERGIDCDSVAADVAARGGHVEVISYLHSIGIRCTSWGADNAAMCGHLNVLIELRKYGIHATTYGTVRAVMHGYSDVVQFLCPTRTYGTSRRPNPIVTDSCWETITSTRSWREFCCIC